MELLLANGADIDAHNIVQKSALFQAMHHKEDSSISKFLIEQGADLSTKPFLGNSRNALDQATVSSNVAVVKLLLAKGMKPSRGILRGASDPTIAQLLIDHGADVNFVPLGYDDRSILRWMMDTGRGAAADVVRANGAKLDMNVQPDEAGRRR